MCIIIPNNGTKRTASPKMKHIVDCEAQNFVIMRFSSQFGTDFSPFFGKNRTKREVRESLPLVFLAKSEPTA